jgi:hypothetical protein
MSNKRKRNRGKIVIFLLFITLFYGVFVGLKKYKYHNTTSSLLTQSQIDDMEFGEDDTEKMDTPQTIKTVEKDKCTPPEWAIKMGHKDMWLEHHGCK